MVGEREDESDDARQGHRDRDYGETEDEVGVPVGARPRQTPIDEQAKTRCRKGRRDAGP